MLTASSPAGSRRTVQWRDLTDYWIDTTLANKGIGVQSICKILDFDLADVMAFGDNYNDVSMLDIVGHPYIMDGAVGPLRENILAQFRPEDAMAL